MSESKVVPVHSDDEAVDRFAAAMKKKLAQKRAEGRGGWDDRDECTISSLEHMLHQHYRKGDVIDIANFCMMLHQRGMPSKWRLTEPREFAMAQVCIDVHYALGVKWGEDIYAKIKTLTDAAPSADQGELATRLQMESENIKSVHQIRGADLAVWYRLMKDAAAALQSAQAERKDAERYRAQRHVAWMHKKMKGGFNEQEWKACYDYQCDQNIEGTDAYEAMKAEFGNKHNPPQEPAIDAAIAGK